MLCVYKKQYRSRALLDDTVHSIKVIVRTVCRDVNRVDMDSLELVARGARIRVSSRFHNHHHYLHFSGI